MVAGELLKLSQRLVRHLENVTGTRRELLRQFDVQVSDLLAQFEVEPARRRHNVDGDPGVAVGRVAAPDLLRPAVRPFADARKKAVQLSQPDVTADTRLRSLRHPCAASDEPILILRRQDDQSVPLAAGVDVERLGRVLGIVGLLWHGSALFLHSG